MFKNKLIRLTYLSLIGLMLLQVYFSSRRATDGDKYMELNNKFELLSLENTRLKNQIFHLTTLEKINTYAQNTHMTPSIVRLLGSVSVASRLGLP